MSKRKADAALANASDDAPTSGAKKRARKAADSAAPEQDHESQQEQDAAIVHDVSAGDFKREAGAAMDLKNPSASGPTDSDRAAVAPADSAAGSGLRLSPSGAQERSFLGAGSSSSSSGASSSAGAGSNSAITHATSAVGTFGVVTLHDAVGLQANKLLQLVKDAMEAEEKNGAGNAFKEFNAIFVEQSLTELSRKVQAIVAATTAAQMTRPAVDCLLRIAAAAGHLGVVDALVKLGRANVNACSPNGASPLVIAAQQGQAEMIPYLLKHHNANPNVGRSGLNGDTVLHIVARKKDASLNMKIAYEALIRHNANRSATNKKGELPEPPASSSASAGSLKTKRLSLGPAIDMRKYGKIDIQARDSATAAGSGGKDHWHDDDEDFDGGEYDYSGRVNKRLDDLYDDERDYEF